ncbi:Aste57867_17529 [Aphanomyces stellatus]|uniref:Aste57867_17529 protein n=1 Tax=Aphanomyces stellatus TaxID=120398 RepID=A0A485LBL6_9STRA|nr:hypothetical protein As57867_017469 [Aphanomyces stellatus]VFT94282.1 Aste57867_17529 [Aphanomyces stellatus]
MPTTHFVDEHLAVESPQDDSDSDFTREAKPSEIPRCFYDGNFTIWWAIGTVLVLWFTVYKGMGVVFGLLPPPRDVSVGPAFAIHLVTACLFTWICIFNVFHSPSHGEYYRKVHIILGRLAMVAGLLSFMCGVVAAWHERYSGNLYFAVGNTAGGCLQVFGQLMGWYQIRRKDVRGYQFSMLLTFYYGCLIPMWSGIPAFFFNLKPPGWVGLVLVAAGLVYGQFGLRAALAKRMV